MPATPRTLVPARWLLLLAMALPSLTRAQTTDPAVTEPAATQPADTESTGDFVGWLEIAGRLRDGDRPVAWVPAEDDEPTLTRVLRQLHTVATDPAYRGVVIYLDDAQLTLNQVQQISAAIDRARAAGKPILTFAESYSLTSYLLACSADRILLQHKGLLILESLGVEEMYLLGLLDKIGLKADMLQVGRYKGAMDPYTRSTPSPEWNENFDHLLDDLYDQILHVVTSRRQMSVADFNQALTDVWSMQDQDYLKAGLVDELTDRDMVGATSTAFGDDFSWDRSMGYGENTRLDASNPFALFQMLLQRGRERITRDSIMVLHAQGPIMSGQSVSDGLLAPPQHAGVFIDAAIGSKTMLKILGDAQDEPRVKGVVIALDSPGGSALASEVIWQAVRATARTKPLYVSVGRMAASGGYYIASAGQQIYVLDGSILGSIGVVGGKLVLGGLYDKLGLSIHRRSRGPLGDMFNSVEPFTEPQRAALLKAFENTYHTFTDRVLTGRGQRLTDLSAVGEGRLFTGRQAVANGMADKIGGLDQAVADMAQELGLKQGQYDVIDRPGPLTLPEYLDRLFGVMAPGQLATPLTSLDPQQQAVLAAARAAMGPQRWASAAQVLTALLQLQHEHTLLITPNALDITP
ncbi:MAG: S49 family peptidase [Phycisphaeraceae bacterium]|nr:S49 family peptidase [Phycisphaeraceae bacterium]